MCYRGSCVSLHSEVNITSDVVFTVILAIVLVAAAIVGWHKGAIAQIGSIAAVVGALIVCRSFGPMVVPMVSGWLGVDEAGQSAWSDYSASLLAYAAVFMIAWLLVWMLTRMIRNAIHLVHLGVIDRLGGSIFLVAKWVLVGSILLNLLKVVQPDAAVFAHTAASQPWQAPLVDAVLAFAPWLWGWLGINL